MTAVDWVTHWLATNPKPEAAVPANLAPAERIWDAYNYAITHPDEWDQGTWGFEGSCGTTFCVGGHLAHRAGLRLMPDPRGWVPSGVLDYVPLDDLPPDLALAAQEEREVRQFTETSTAAVSVEWVIDHLLDLNPQVGTAIWYCLDRGHPAQELRDQITAVFGPDPGGAPQC